MQLKANGKPLVASPSEFKVTILDLDDADSSVRTSDGKLNRDRVRVIRQIEIGWNALTGVQIKQILDAMENVFFDFTFPDPKAGGYITRKMYVGDRSAPVAFERKGVLWYKDLKFTLTEQ
ncbi:hypothetical protein RE628_11515 [Paenibacillus sp. D2_2]|uniref:DUF6711 family protein n=1 Tax=Paenibacillus sp. D2_2 TaxID=3073092 RepID=UPI002814C5F0|nr:DUF6711 family protein [Paenibacillus sp. D2_2]WMT42853.1 hypothetical protein RE628_11515 [Paenibacillus sp. D2_2]